MNFYTNFHVYCPIWAESGKRAVYVTLWSMSVSRTRFCYQHKWNYIYMCTVELKDILKTANTLVKSVNCAVLWSAPHAILSVADRLLSQDRVVHILTCLLEHDRLTNKITHLRYMDLIAMLLKIQVLWDALPCHQDRRFQGFKGLCSLYLHGWGDWAEEVFEI